MICKNWNFQIKWLNAYWQTKILNCFSMSIDHHKKQRFHQISLDARHPNSSTGQSSDFSPWVFQQLGLQELIKHTNLQLIFRMLKHTLQYMIKQLKQLDCLLEICFLLSVELFLSSLYLQIISHFKCVSSLRFWHVKGLHWFMLKISYPCPSLSHICCN